ncbi:MAG TPA: hypothetical protein VJJ81_01155 [Candidatus Babeliales bacterium]|nr:hypothetical protein [Candidatus Babeliales bacterium]
MSKSLCLLSLVLSMCCLKLDALTVMPNRTKLPEFSPIDSNSLAAKLLAERVKKARISRCYAQLQALYIAHVGELQELVQVAPIRLPYMKIWPEPEFKTTVVSSGRSSSSGSGSTSPTSAVDSSGSKRTISSPDSRLLSPSSDSDDR